jgi:N-acyl-D-amino-acid deacylase
MDLKDIARIMNLSEEKAVQKLLPAGAIYFAMDEKDVQRILAFEHTMIGSDGLPHDAMPHPRLWGTFGRVLGHYRRLGLFTLEEAVYKMTGLTAATFGLAGRGVVKEGFAADLVLLDDAAVDDAATFEKPIAYTKGIETVIVNGEPVWHDGRSTGARPGQVLTRGVMDASIG